MATKNFVILDAATQTYIEDLVIRPRDVGGAADGYLIRKRRLRGGLQDGIDEIHVENGQFSFVVLPTRGMSIWKAWHGQTELGWKSPIPGPVHPQFVPLADPGGLGWLDGFDELLVRCGLESNGAPDFDDKNHLRYPLHGRIGNKPAREVRVGVDGDSGEITITGVVDERRFHFQKLRLVTELRTRPGELGFRIRDEIHNLSGTAAEAQILYHVNFGLPLLDSGARLVCPAKTVVPRNQHAASSLAAWDSYRAPEAGFEEQVYFLHLLGDNAGRTRVLLKNAHATQGVSLHYNVQQLPCFSLWKDTADVADGYVTGIEPGTNFPNPRSFEGQQGRVAKLAPGAKEVFEVALEWHPDAASIEQAEAAVARLQSQPAQVFDAPQPGWCA